MEVRYTPDEIDRMRFAVRELLFQERTFRIAAEAVVEARLRTYMENGTSPDVLDMHVHEVLRSLPTAHGGDRDRPTDLFGRD